MAVISNQSISLSPFLWVAVLFRHLVAVFRLAISRTQAGLNGLSGGPSNVAAWPICSWIWGRTAMASAAAPEGHVFAKRSTWSVILTPSSAQHIDHNLHGSPSWEMSGTNRPLNLSQWCTKSIQKHFERRPIMTHHPISCEHYQASSGNGWSRIYLEALEASKKVFQEEAGIGDSLSSQAKRSLAHSSPPRVVGCKITGALDPMFYIMKTLKNMQKHETSTFTVGGPCASKIFEYGARLWFLLVMVRSRQTLRLVGHLHDSIITSFKVHDLNSHLPYQRCLCTKPELSNRMIAGSTDASPVWPLAISSSKSVKDSLERQPLNAQRVGKKKIHAVQTSYPSNLTAVDYCLQVQTR